MLWQSQVADQMRRLLLEVKKDVRSDYLRLVTQYLDMYEGDHSSWFEKDGHTTHPDDRSPAHVAYLQKYFPDAWAHGTGDLQPYYVPFLRTMDHKVAALYRGEVRFVLTDDQGNDVLDDHPQAKIWRRICDGCDFAESMKEAQRKPWLVKTILAYVDMHPTFDEIRVHIKTPDLVDVWEGDEDPTDLWYARLVSMELPTPRNSAWESRTNRASLGRRFAVLERGKDRDSWTVQITDVGGNQTGLAQPFAGDGINPLGRYPFVVFHDGSSPYGIYQDLDDCLLQGQIGVNLCLTDMMFAQKQHASRLAIIGSGEKANPTEIPMGRDRVMRFGGDVEVQYISDGLNFSGMWEGFEKLLKTYATMYEVLPDLFALSGDTVRQALTAVAKAADQVVLQTTVEDFRRPWARHARDLFRLVRHVWNYAHPGEKLESGLSIRTEWGAAKVAEDRLHAAQADQAEINIGRKSALDLIMRDHPGMTRERAQEIFEENMRQREMNHDAGPGTRQTPDEESGPEM
mgnify:FL=1